MLIAGHRRQVRELDGSDRTTFVERFVDWHFRVRCLDELGNLVDAWRDYAVILRGGLDRAAGIRSAVEEEAGNVVAKLDGALNHIAGPQQDRFLVPEIGPVRRDGWGRVGLAIRAEWVWAARSA